MPLTQLPLTIIGEVAVSEGLPGPGEFFASLTRASPMSLHAMRM